MIRRISERKSVVSACDEDICHLTVVLCVPRHILLCCECCPNSSARILGLKTLTCIGYSVKVAVEHDEVLSSFC